VTAFVLLVLATLFGCSLLFKDAAGQSGWYIRLNIGNPAAGKAISVGEYEVTEVYIEVFAPEADQPFYAVSWYADDGSASYLIPVSEQGQYRIEVTHISGDGGDPVEATECANFNIQAMVITVIDIIPGSIGVIDVLGGGEEPVTEEYGTLLLTLSPAGMAAKTIVPPLDMNIAYHDVYGDGPDSTTFSRIGIPGPTLVEGSLVVGDWTITVDAFNADDDLIGYGSVVAKITAGQLTQSEVSITPLEGTGSLDVIISWPESTVASPVMTGTLTAEAGAP
jgi:hypothetical protein